MVRSHSFVVGADVHAGLNDVARESNSSLFMVVHAALAVLLARLSGTSDIAIGTPVAGRGEQVLDDLIGMFVNTLVLRTEVDSSESVRRSLLGRVCVRLIFRRLRMRMFRSSGWWRCSIRRGRRLGVRCSR